MDFITELNKDLANGFSKSDLEKLIGLPKNSLSGVLRGSKKLSKKSQIKIDVWSKSEKPNPIDLKFEKLAANILDNTKVKEAHRQVFEDLVVLGQAAVPPKTLNELRDLCPKELTGL